MARLERILLFAIAAGLPGLASTAAADWGIDRLLVTGRLGQYGLAADRTLGADTVFAGVVLWGDSADSVRLLRTTDRGENWSAVWQLTATAQHLWNLTLRVGSGAESWVYLFWISDSAGNNGDLRGARVGYDGAAAQLLWPIIPGPDTIYWLTCTRTFDPAPVLYLFWQDENGQSAHARNPALKYSSSADFGQSWTVPCTLSTGFETPAADCGGPGQLFVVSRSTAQHDIRADVSSDSGRTWTSERLTGDSTRNDDMFPQVAATHDSAPANNVWVTYDSYRSSGWGVRCAYSRDGGQSWSLDRPFSGGNGNQFWSSLGCACGSRLGQGVYVSSAPGDYHVFHRAGTNASPVYWSSALNISDSVATNTMPPVVTSYSGPGDSLGLGLIFYAGLGPRDVWYDAWQFIAVEEPGARADRAEVLSAQVRDGVLQVLFGLAEPGPATLGLYGLNGRRLKNLAAGSWTAGSHSLSTPVADLASGTWILGLQSRSRFQAVKVIQCR